VVRPFINGVAASVDLRRADRRTETEFKNEIEGFFQKLYADRNDLTLNHTLLRKFIVASHANFVNVVIPFLQDEQKEFVREAFINYTPV
jgi:hypothetical protein